MDGKRWWVSLSPTLLPGNQIISLNRPLTPSPHHGSKRYSAIRLGRPGRAKDSVLGVLWRVF